MTRARRVGHTLFAILSGSVGGMAGVRFPVGRERGG